MHTFKNYISVFPETQENRNQKRHIMTTMHTYIIIFVQYDVSTRPCRTMRQ